MRTIPRGMPLVLLAAALVGCVANNTTSTRSTSNKMEDAPKLAPDIRGTDADEKSFRLSDYRGKVVLLDFWAEF